IAAFPTKEMLLNHSTINHYLSMQPEGRNPYDPNYEPEDVLLDRKLLDDVPTVLFSVNTTDSENHIFIQYWFFQSWSATVAPGFSIDESYHEGDIEFCQLAIVKRDDRHGDIGFKKNWVAPLGMFASQHYYGQTVEWNRFDEEHDPNPRRKQLFVIHKDHRPSVYIARGTHAMFFSDGEFGVGIVRGKLGDFPQYARIPALKEETGTFETGIMGINWLSLDYNDDFFTSWLGRWGHKVSAPNGSSMEDGPFGPPNRGGKRKSGGDGVSRFLTTPVYLHNIAIWNNAPSDVQNRLRINKENWERP
ncbi:hypothetical protein QA601_18790, partial [Chitinispirillales bacterium ANBcel5]|uniref:hypothetical protein n=1 Tax=Cellulosispirillum alkaliphilum TaxID=3039283 RepID=UPI002A4E33AA|nr:hypothetical protein [Chitinispirillales bacterium ANBcel5]